MAEQAEEMNTELFSDDGKTEITVVAVPVKGGRRPSVIVWNKRTFVLDGESYRERSCHIIK